MFPFKEKRAFGLQRDFNVLAREKRVTKILGSHAFRTELEGILQGQLDGSRSPPKPSRALSSLQENVAPAAAMEAARRAAGSGGGGGSAISSVIPINDLRGARSSRYILSERQLRCKLASLCRLVDWFRWSQLLDNHVSARERDGFLMSPYGLLYGEVTASCLVRVGMDGAVLDGGSTRLGVNHAGVGLHSAVYGARRDAHCVVHLHTVAGAAVSVMRCGLLPISEEALSVGKVSYYDGKTPLTGQNQKREFVKALGKSKVLILRNHGLVAVGNSVEECFHLMYNLIRACEIQVAAVSAGLANLTQLPDVRQSRGENAGWAAAAAAAGGVWNTRGHMEFEALMRMLDNLGYQTGYRYRGLSLLQAEGDSGRPVAWDEVVEGGEGDRLHRRRGMKEKTKHELEVWSFLDDDRSRNKPLTKNTKIRVRARGQGGSKSPVKEEKTSRDPWEFLTSRESSAFTPESKTTSRPSTAQRAANTTSEGSGADMANASTSSHTRQHSSASGRRRHRRRNKSNNSGSSQAPTPAGAALCHQSHPPAGLYTNPTTSPGASTAVATTLLPPLDLRTLEETAERVARSTGAAVKKLSMKVLEEVDLERSHSEPNLVSTREHLVPRMLDKRLVDWQGYSAGDEASNQGSPHKAEGESWIPSPSYLDTIHSKHSASHTDTPSPLPQLITGQNFTPHTSSTSPVTHPPLTHTPVDISWLSGYSSAEKAAHVARLVADSTGSAVQKLSQTMADRHHQLSLSNSQESSTL